MQLHSYPQVYALGHAGVADLFLDPVILQEKIDGSQFSFGFFPEAQPSEIVCRSKGADLWAWAWPQLRRMLTSGLPEWYKDELLKAQFSGPEVRHD